MCCLTLIYSIDKTDPKLVQSFLPKELSHYLGELQCLDAKPLKFLAGKYLEGAGKNFASTKFENMRDPIKIEFYRKHFDSFIKMSDK